ncbi:MAG TPA: YlxR family protein [Candidatus Limnocylindrales bacterium]
MACRTPRQKRELLRVVRTPGGAIVLDASGRAPGRGAYVCAADACQDAALAKGALRRALAVPIPAGLFDPVRAAATAVPMIQNQDDRKGGA